MSETPYDEVPYESQPIPYTAPEQLSLVSQYFGGPASHIDGCRYLEVGCGAGGNLLPLAFYRRTDQFVGIDSSAAALDVARAAASSMGLENLELIEADLADPATLADERFDFVLAHGVLSWIAPELRASLLALVGRTLATNGVACVSYNTMPGFGPRGMLRDTLLRLSDHDAPLRDRVTQARGVAAFLIQQLEPLDTHPYAAMMVHEAKRALDATEGYVAHELLATHNHAFWFGELEALARRHDLEQIGDNWLYQPAQAPPTDVLQAVYDFTEGDTRRMELLDAVRYRQHRSMLLRRADADDEAGGTKLIERVRVACEGNVKVPASARAAIIALARAWPRSLAFSELRDHTDDVDELEKELLDWFIEGSVELRLRDPVFAHSASSRVNAVVRHLSATAGVMCSPTHHTWMPSDEQRAEIAAEKVTDAQFRTMLGTWGMLEREPDSR